MTEYSVLYDLSEKKGDPRDAFFAPSLRQVMTQTLLYFPMLLLIGIFF